MMTVIWKYKMKQTLSSFHLLLVRIFYNNSNRKEAGTVPQMNWWQYRALLPADVKSILDEPDHDAELKTRDTGGWMIGKVGVFILFYFEKKTGA